MMIMMMLLISSRRPGRNPELWRHLLAQASIPHKGDEGLANLIMHSRSESTSTNSGQIVCVRILYLSCPAVA